MNVNQNTNYVSSSFLNDPHINQRRSQSFIQRYQSSQVNTKDSLIREHFTTEKIIQRLEQAAAIIIGEEREDKRLQKRRRRSNHPVVIDTHFLIPRQAIQRFRDNQEADRLPLHGIDISTMIDHFISRIEHNIIQLPNINSSSSSSSSTTAASTTATVAITAGTSGNFLHDQELNHENSNFTVDVSPIASTSSSFTSNINHDNINVDANRFEFDDHDIDVHVENDNNGNATTSNAQPSTHVNLNVPVPLPPSSTALLSSWLLLWRLQHKISKSSLDSLLQMVGQYLSFNTSSNANDQNIPFSLPSSEQHLRRSLELPPMDDVAESFTYIQCSYTYCGKLYSKLNRNLNH